MRPVPCFALRCPTFLAALALVGCAPYTIPPDYSAATGCAEDQVEVSEYESASGQEFYRARGCGHAADYICVGDRCESPVFVVARRHSAQFGCPISNVQLVELGGGAWQAVGCGQALTYQCGRDLEIVVRCIAETSRRGYGQVSP